MAAQPNGIAIQAAFAVVVAAIASPGCKNGTAESPTRSASSRLPAPDRAAQAAPTPDADGLLPIEGGQHIATDDDYTCVLHDDGLVSCWGHVEASGLLDREWKYSAATVVPDAFGVKQLAMDQAGVVYARRGSGKVVAWGSAVVFSYPGQESRQWDAEATRALDTLEARLDVHPGEVEFRRVSSASLDAASVRAMPTWFEVEGLMFASDHCTCLYDSRGRLSCLSGMGMRDPFLPAWMAEEKRKVPGLRDVQASYCDPGCWLFDDGRVECWSTEADHPFVKREPGRISLPAKVVALKYASSVWVAVLDDGRIAVWHGDFQPYFLDRPSDVTQVDHGVGRVCAVTKDEEVWCWWLRPWKPGRGVDMSADEELTRVEGVEHPVQVAVSAFHACALQKDGRVRCWGKNSEGQCGIGRFTETVDEPTLVVTKAGS